MISAPYAWRSWARSTLTLSGITTASLYPLRRDTKAREMPVLPLVGSRIVRLEPSSPSRSAWSIIFRAMRSFTLPVGFCPSSLAKIRTSALGLMRCSSTIGVFANGGQDSFVGQPRCHTACLGVPQVSCLALSLVGSGRRCQLGIRRRQPAEDLVVDEFGDRGVVSAQRAFGVPPQLDLPEVHAQSVDEQQA